MLQIIFVAVSVLFLTMTHAVTYKTGQNHGSATIASQWAHAANEQAASEIRLLRAALEDEKRKAKEDATRLANAINAQHENTKQLERDIKRYRSDNSGLRVTADICKKRVDTLSRASADSELAGAGADGPGEVRLPVQTESGLWEIMHDAGKLVGWYQTCRKELCGLKPCL